MLAYFVETAYTSELDQSWTEAMFDTREKANRYVQTKLKQEVNLHESDRLTRWLFEMEVEND